jgi:hypothetical protein
LNFENILLTERGLKPLEATINNIDIKNKNPIKIKNNKENI